DLLVEIAHALGVAAPDEGRDALERVVHVRRELRAAEEVEERAPEPHRDGFEEGELDAAALVGGVESQRALAPATLVEDLDAELAEVGEVAAERPRVEIEPRLHVVGADPVWLLEPLEEPHELLRLGETVA